MDTSARSLSTSQAVNPWEAIKAAVAQVGRVAETSTVQKGALSCLMVGGALDKRIAKEIKQQARAFANGEASAWAIDLAGVTTWDSEGLAALVYALDVSELAGKPFSLLSPSAALRRTLERAQLHRLFVIVTER
jgi:anti-anti-sigma factor